MNVTVWCQIDILIQCHANIISLILPALISGLNKSESINKLEILGFALWFLCLYLENKADM